METVTADLPELPLSVEHLHLTELEALRLLEGRRLRCDARVMDPKAQIGERHLTTTLNG
jgi:acetyl esterase